MEKFKITCIESCILISAVNIYSAVIQLFIKKIKYDKTDDKLDFCYDNAMEFSIQNVEWLKRHPKLGMIMSR